MDNSNVIYLPTETTSEEYTPVLTITRRLIKEVKKRPLLWDRKHDYYNSRVATDREWVSIAAVMEEHKEFLRLKWKNLRDQFQKELRKVRFPLRDDTEKSYLASYPGKWIHFEALLFLKDSIKIRHTAGNFYNILDEIEVNHRSPSLEEASEKNDDDDEKEESEIKIKEEFEVFEESILGYDTETPNVLPMHADKVVPVILSTAKETIKEKNNDTDLKRKNSNDADDYQERIKCRKLPAENADENDDDLHFFKSLLPYMRNLNPIRKLIVRNEIQTLLMKESLCEKCKGHSCDN